MAPEEREDARRMLEAAGFTYSEGADCWLHRGEGRVIPRQTVEAHDTEWLAHWITGR